MDKRPLLSKIPYLYYSFCWHLPSALLFDCDLGLVTCWVWGYRTSAVHLNGCCWTGRAAHRHDGRRGGGRRRRVLPGQGVVGSEILGWTDFSHTSCRACRNFNQIWWFGFTELNYPGLCFESYFIFDEKTIRWLVGSHYRSEVIVMKFDQTLNKSNKICQGQSRFNLSVIQVYEISTLSCLEFWRYLDRNHGR